MHHFDLTLVGTASDDARYLFNSTLQAAGVNGSHASSATRSRRGAARGRRRACARSSRGIARCAASRRAIRTPRTSRSCSPRTSRRPLAEDPSARRRVQRRSAGSDPFPTIPNCPGADRLVRERRRRSARERHRRSSVAHRRRRASRRQQRRARRRDRRGHAPRHRDSLHRRHADPQPVPRPHVRAAVRRSRLRCAARRRPPCPTVDESVLRYRTRYTAAYVEDTWHADAEDRGRRRPALGADVGRLGAALLEPARARAWASAGIRSATVARACGRAWAAATRCCPPASATTILPRDRTVDASSRTFGEGRLGRYRRGRSRSRATSSRWRRTS